MWNRVPLLALLALLPATAVAKDSPIGTIEGARDPTGQDRVTLGLRGGAVFLAGSQGAAYTPGPAVGLLTAIHFSEYASFTVDLDWSTHRVDDPGRLFDQDDLLLPLDASNVTGSQRWYHLDLGLQFDLGTHDPTRTRPDRTVASPWVRFAGGVSYSDTLLEVATLEGRQAMRAKRPHGALCPAFGVTFAFPRLVSLTPTFKSVTIFGIDHDEVSEKDTLRAVFRLQPSLDLLFRF
ncbi:MAG: hypothetical protein ABIO70_01545 [Pseudomonadota bacterium]